MKKFLVLCFAFVLLVPFVSYAASIGGAETQGKGKVAVGFDSAFIFDRDLKFKSASGLSAAADVKEVEIDKGYQIMLKSSYGLLDNLDVYVKLGTADYDVDAAIYNKNTGVKDSSEEINTSTDFAYGFGLKGSYDLTEIWLIGCDLQYLMSKHKTKIAETTIATGEIESTTYKSGTFQEWHIAPYVGYRAGNFLPYLGVRYSDVKLSMKSPADSGWTDDHKYEADDNFGVFLGTDYKMGETCSLNLECRFIDETAMSAGISWKF